MIYKPSQEDQAIIFLKRCFEKKRYVKIEYIPEKKTISQNNYIWLVFTVIAEDTGNIAQDIYEYYLEKFPTYKEIDILGEIKSVRITLSQFSKEQTSIFIDRFTTDARVEGFVIPDPEDKAVLEQYQYYQQRGLL